MTPAPAVLACVNEVATSPVPSVLNLGGGLLLIRNRSSLHLQAHFGDTAVQIALDPDRAARLCAGLGDQLDAMRVATPLPHAAE